jgi:hypothetical protein
VNEHVRTVQGYTNAPVYRPDTREACILCTRYKGCKSTVRTRCSIEEIKTCSEKDVWKRTGPHYKAKGAIPSKTLFTPKKLPNGNIDDIKGRAVAGGHRRNRSLYQDTDISSPTVALTSVLAIAAIV